MYIAPEMLFSSFCFLMFLPGIQPAIKSADEYRSSRYITCGRPQEVGSETGEGDFRARENPGRNKKHIGYTVLVAQSHERRYGKPAADRLARQRPGSDREPYRQAHTPVGSYAPQKTRSEEHTSELQSR